MNEVTALQILTTQDLTELVEVSHESLGVSAEE